MSIAAPAGLDGREHLGVAERAPGLDDRGHAGVEEELGAVGEREERIRGGDGALRAGGRVEALRLGDRLAAGVDAADLA